MKYLNRILVFDDKFAPAFDEDKRQSIKFCCDTLRQQVLHKCEQHGYNCPDNLVQIRPGMKDGFFWVARAQNADYQISFCPFCGKKLPIL